MTPPARPKPATTSPDDPVQAALDDPEMRNKLYRQAQSKLRAWLADRKPTTRSELAEDIVQETATRALDNREKFDPSLGKSVAAWLHGFVSIEQAGLFRLGGDIEAAFHEGLAILLDGIAARAGA